MGRDGDGRRGWMRLAVQVVIGPESACLRQLRRPMHKRVAVGLPGDAQQQRQ